MIKVFLSHSSLDKDLVQNIYQKLSKSSAWYDAANIENGERIPDKINEGLRYCTHFVLFWSYNSCKSSWVQAELNAAFVKTMSDKCKFMIFTLDKTELPELLKPYKYDYIDKSNLELATEFIVNKIMAQDIVEARLHEFVNRTKEIGDIEESVHAGYKLIILNGILGIGKSSLAKKALQWLYSNRAVNRLVIDFNTVPGFAELSLDLSRQTQKKLLNSNKTLEDQRKNVQYFLEYISSSNILLILKDVKTWLNEDGTPNNNLLFIMDIIVKTNMFEQITIITTSRYIELPSDYHVRARQLHINGMGDIHIAQIIKNNLTTSFKSEDEKNIKFAERLYGYPLGAKLGAYRIANHGYDYYLEQPQKIYALKVSLAKQLISYAAISEQCVEYLKIVALCKSRLRSEEYISAFPKFKNDIAMLADEAFFAGILRFEEDGCYKLELLVEDYFYELAFNSTNQKSICKELEKYLLSQIQEGNDSGKYLRLIPAAIHILTLNGNIQSARELRSELTATIVSGMWDQYNHREYDEAVKIAEDLLSNNECNIEASYVKALCLSRFDDFNGAEEILNELRSKEPANARYYYALGRIKKRQGKYEEAIEFFKIASMKRRYRYLSAYREMAECYLYLNQLQDAQVAIANAKEIDDNNMFVILLEARLYQMENRADKALELLSNQSSIEQDPSQFKFRKGRIYDQLGKKEDAKNCYENALTINPKAYDARLCLLNHQILDAPDSAFGEIEELKPKLRGKRKYILINIEARFIGYYGQDEDKAMKLLDSIPEKQKDRQWYAVRYQLLQKLIDKHSSIGREQLVKIYTKEQESLIENLELKFGEKNIVETDFLPDA